MSVPLDGRPVATVGIDLVEVERIRRACGRGRFVQRVFTPAEAEYCRRAADPGPRFAARFAAKEATMKALGVGLGAVGLAEIEVVLTPSGRPRLELVGAALARRNRLGLADLLVSLSHTDRQAQAVVVGVT